MPVSVRLLIALLAAGTAASSTIAGPVALNEGKGQGLTFSHRGNCYVLFPNHVEPDGLLVRLFTPAPQAAGSATVYFRRPEADIALGLVQGSAAARCGDAFSRLPTDVSRRLSGARRATLERVDAQGAVERLAMRIDRIAWARLNDGPGAGDYQYIIASTDIAAGENREVFQGTSGAFLYIDGEPVGMTVTAPDDTTVRVLRWEEMREPVARWLASGSFGALAGQETEKAPQIDGIAFEVTEWTGEPEAESTGPAALASGTGPFRARPVSGPVSLVAEIPGGAPVPLKSLILQGPSDDSPAAAPRLVRVEVDRSRSGPARFQPVWSGEMPPDGAELEVPLVTFARRVRVIVQSGWAPGPVEISRLILVPAE